MLRLLIKSLHYVGKQTMSPHTHTHSDIGFQLTQFPGGRKVENRKVKRSARTVWFNLVFNCTRKRSDTQRGCKSAASLRWENLKGFVVYHENNHGTNEQQQGGPLESVC